MWMTLKDLKPLKSERVSWIRIDWLWLWNLQENQNGINDSIDDGDYSKLKRWRPHTKDGWVHIDLLLVLFVLPERVPVALQSACQHLLESVGYLKWGKPTCFIKKTFSGPLRESKLIKSPLASVSSWVGSRSLGIYNMHLWRVIPSGPEL